MERVLFVCSGNICRSPAGQEICKLEARRMGLELEVGSCGTLRLPGEPAAPFTIKALEERGVDMSAFRSRALSYFLLREADHILCMEQHHLEEVLHELGGDRDLVKTLAVITEFHPDETFRNDAGIYDFVRAEWPEYREGIAEVEACVRHFLHFLDRSADRSSEES